MEKKEIENKFNGIMWLASIPAEQLTKNYSLNLHSVFRDWHEKHQDIVIDLPPILQKEHKFRAISANPQKEFEKAESVKKPENIPAPETQKKDTDKPKKEEKTAFNIKGRYLFQEKIAEIENRIMYSGMVNNPNDLDLEDSFIDDKDYLGSDSSVLLLFFNNKGITTDI